MPLAEFYLLPGQDAHNEVALAADELLTEVVIPAPAETAKGAYVKVAERQAWDFCLVSVAVQLTLDGATVRAARVALGGAAPVPWRATAAEEALIGQTLDGETIARAALAATDGARPLAQNGYKVEMAQGVVRQALQSLR
jgi:xanthine dehydrogenase YagS FAD-binding subunit